MLLENKMLVTTKMLQRTHCTFIIKNSVIKRKNESEWMTTATRPTRTWKEAKEKAKKITHFISSKRKMLARKRHNFCKLNFKSFSLLSFYLFIYLFLFFFLPHFFSLNNLLLPFVAYFYYYHTLVGRLQYFFFVYKYLFTSFFASEFLWWFCLTRIYKDNGLDVYFYKFWFLKIICMVAHCIFSSYLLRLVDRHQYWSNKIYWKCFVVQV